MSGKLTSADAAVGGEYFAGLPERYQPTNLPRCAVCGSQIVGTHACPSRAAPGASAKGRRDMTGLPKTDAGVGQEASW